jgi:hypothetical protein
MEDLIIDAEKHKLLEVGGITLCSEIAQVAGNTVCRMLRTTNTLCRLL